MRLDPGPDLGKAHAVASVHKRLRRLGGTGSASATQPFATQAEVTSAGTSTAVPPVTRACGAAIGFCALFELSGTGEGPVGRPIVRLDASEQNVETFLPFRRRLLDVDEPGTAAGQPVLVLET